MKQEWKYYEPSFDADKYNYTMLRFSPWSGHRRFAYDLISFYEPDILVELGSFYGCSSFSFMQAIKDFHLKTKIYPVDLWEAGDTFTSHDYEQDVFGFFEKIRKKEFGHINVDMLKMTFDEASKKFMDNTIDILHIDGSHLYEDVKHDYMTWISKVKADGIILFHDISEQLLYDNILGSCIFWKELKQNYKWTLEMPYSWGLGILFLSKEKYKDFLQKVDLNYYLSMNTYEEAICKDKIRKDYFKIQDLNKWIESLKKDKAVLEKDNRRLIEETEKTKQDYEETVKGKEKYITQLEKKNSAFQQENQLIKNDYKKTTDSWENLKDENNKLIEEIEKIKQDYEDTIDGKDKYIIELEKKQEGFQQENQKIKCDYEHTIDGKDKYIEELEKKQISLQQELLKIKHDFEQTFDDKDAYIKELETSISYYKFIIQSDNLNVE